MTPEEKDKQIEDLQEHVIELMLAVKEAQGERDTWEMRYVYLKEKYDSERKNSLQK